MLILYYRRYIWYFSNFREKIDNTFTISQFSINGYRMFRRNRNYFGGGLYLFVKDSIASKQLNSHNANINEEAIYLEINIRKRKRLIIGTYKPPNQNHSLFLKNLLNNLSDSRKHESATFYRFFQSRELNTWNNMF